MAADLAANTRATASCPAPLRSPLFSQEGESVGCWAVGLLGCWAVKCSLYWLVHRKTSCVQWELKNFKGIFKVLCTKVIFMCFAAVEGCLWCRPVKMHMSLWDNSKVVGKRFPYYMEYEAGCDDHGKLLAIKMEIYADCGMQSSGSGSISGLAKWLDGSMWLFDIFKSVANSYQYETTHETQCPGSLHRQALNNGQPNVILNRI